MKRWAIAWMMMAVITLVLIVQKTKAESTEARVGAAAPPFELVDSQGRVHRLTDYRGTVVVLHFQSCDCPWEGAYQPILNHLAQKCDHISAYLPAAKQVRFLAINAIASESMEQIRAYIQIAGMSYPVLKDFDHRTTDIYGAQTTPHIFVIDSDDQQTLVYKGGIEQSPPGPQHCGQSRQQYLEPFLMTLILDNDPQATETPSTGGSIHQKNRDSKS